MRHDARSKTGNNVGYERQRKQTSGFAVIQAQPPHPWCGKRIEVRIGPDLGGRREMAAYRRSGTRDCEAGTLRTGGWAVIAAETLDSGSGDGGDNAVGDHAHAVVLCIGDVDPPGGIDGDTSELIELRIGGRPVVAAVANVAIPGNGGDDAVSNFWQAVSQKPSAVRWVGDGGVHGDESGTG